MRKLRFAFTRPCATHSTMRITAMTDMQPSASSVIAPPLLVLRKNGCVPSGVRCVHVDPEQRLAKNARDPAAPPGQAHEHYGDSGNDRKCANCRGGVRTHIGAKKYMHARLTADANSSKKCRHIARGCGRGYDVADSCNGADIEHSC